MEGELLYLQIVSAWTAQIDGEKHFVQKRYHMYAARIAKPEKQKNPKVQRLLSKCDGKMVRRTDSPFDWTKKYTLLLKEYN